jgi:hypothetical protein
MPSAEKGPYQLSYGHGRPPTSQAFVMDPRLEEFTKRHPITRDDERRRAAQSSYLEEMRLPLQVLIAADAAFILGANTRVPREAKDTGPNPEAIEVICEVINDVDEQVAKTGGRLSQLLVAARIHIGARKSTVESSQTSTIGPQDLVFYGNLIRCLTDATDLADRVPVKNKKRSTRNS